MPRHYVRKFAAVAVILLFAGSAIAETMTAAGSVVGIVSPELTALERGGQVYNLALGTTVYVGDTIQLRQGGRIELRLSDGSMISSNGPSTFKLDEFVVGGSPGVAAITHGTLSRNLRRSLTFAIPGTTRVAQTNPPGFGGGQAPVHICETPNYTCSVLAFGPCSCLNDRGVRENGTAQ